MEEMTEPVMFRFTKDKLPRPVIVLFVPLIVMILPEIVLNEFVGCTTFKFPVINKEGCMVTFPAEVTTRFSIEIPVPFILFPSPNIISVPPVDCVKTPWPLVSKFPVSVKEWFENVT